MKKALILFCLSFVLISTTACSNQSVSSSKAKEETPTATTTSATTDDTKNEATTTAVDNNAAEQFLAITSPSKGETYNSNLNWNVIRGTTSPETVSIEVNGYKLAKYISGSMNWNYIASTRMKTLEKGENIYAIKAFDKNGNVIETLEYVINYQNGYVLPSVGTGLNGLILFTIALSSLIILRRRFI